MVARLTMSELTGHIGRVRALKPRRYRSRNVIVKRGGNGIPRGVRARVPFSERLVFRGDLVAMFLSMVIYDLVMHHHTHHTRLQTRRPRREHLLSACGASTQPAVPCSCQIRCVCV